MLISKANNTYEKKVDNICGTTPKTIHFVLFAPTAVMASIGPGSMVSSASYNNFAITQIVKINSANTPGI